MGACATALPFHYPGWELSRNTSVLGEIELQLIASQLRKTNNFYAICGNVKGKDREWKLFSQVN